MAREVRVALLHCEGATHTTLLGFQKPGRQEIFNEWHNQVLQTLIPWSGWILEDNMDFKALQDFSLGGVFGNMMDELSYCTHDCTATRHCQSR